MPPEWARHTRTWMSFPPHGSPPGDHARGDVTWAAVANAVASFEPVTMLVPPDRGNVAADLLDPAVQQVPCDLDDAWFRDNGPTFLLDGSGNLGAVHWTFNGWGGRLRDCERDRAAGRFGAGRAGARYFGSSLVNEGGGMLVDGAGTVLVTETVQLDPARNPDWSRPDVESELRAMLGVTHVVWVPQGLTGDYGPMGTNGHIDVVAAFVRPGLVALHRQADPTHPDHEVTRELAEFLRRATDASGRPFDVVTIDGPPPTSEHDDRSYLNFSFVNDGLVLCSFDAGGAADEAAWARFAELFPTRRQAHVDANPIFDCGGGIHCITQQQPAPATDW
jgi:agmatine deiminase